MTQGLTTRIRKGTRFGIRLITSLYRKYEKDNGNLIVASICFYILLTFIPFTLLSISVVGYVVDVSDPTVHLKKYLTNIVPEPYNLVVVTKILKELNLISVSRRLSGPLGLITLFFFAARLFAVIRPCFRIIFARNAKGFIRGKGEELLLTLIFALVQGGIFFSFVLGFAVQTKIINVMPGTVPRILFLFSLDVIEVGFTFVQFFLLYYFLSPIRDKRIIVLSTACATVLWHLGRQSFEHFIIYIVRITAFFGTYGFFISFLIWIYFSVSVFIVCAELLSILADRSRPDRGSVQGQGG